jgi:hypothetical protein
VLTLRDGALEPDEEPKLREGEFELREGALKLGAEEPELRDGAL